MIHWPAELQLAWQRTGTTGETRIYEILAAIEEIFRTRNNVLSVIRALDACRRPLFDCLRGAMDSTVAKAVTLKVLNLCLAKYHFRSRHGEVLSRPFGLIIDPSNFCNLACPGCVHSARTEALQLFQWENGLMPRERMGAFLERYGLYAVNTVFCNYGEPLMNPQTPALIGLAKRYLMHTMLSTNLSIGRFDAEALVLSGLDYMVVSIDGVTQSVYERFRRNGKLDVVLRNLRALVEAKRKLGRRTPVIAWHILAFEHNAHEIPRALDMAQQIGVNHFAALRPFDVSWDDPHIRVADVEPLTVQIDPDNQGAIAGNLIPAEGVLDVQAVDREFAMPWAERNGVCELAARLELAHSAMTCHWLYKSMSMDSKGRVFPCCGAPSPDKDLVFAQFDAGTTADPYNSEKYKMSRLSFANTEVSREGGLAAGKPYCLECEWQKTSPNTNVGELRQFLQAAAGDLFSQASVDLLTLW